MVENCRGEFILQLQIDCGLYLPFSMPLPISQIILQIPASQSRSFPPFLSPFLSLTLPCTSNIFTAIVTVWESREEDANSQKNPISISVAML